jgi:Bacteriocin-protection, YdeI or OmpD-Associated/Domain of unknown function (DUF1905)
VAEFAAVIESARGGGALVELPAEVLEALGGGKRFRVTGTLNGVEFASSTMPIGGGRVCLGLHKATRMQAGVAPGDRVTIAVERDDRPREVEVPAELQEALAGDPEAAEAYERLAFTHRREYAQWVAEAKRPETRARRVAQTLERLRAG